MSYVERYYGVYIDFKYYNTVDIKQVIFSPKHEDCLYQMEGRKIDGRTYILKSSPDKQNLLNILKEAVKKSDDFMKEIIANSEDDYDKSSTNPNSSVST